MSDLLLPEEAEARRIAALKDLIVLDSPPEPLFDSITKMASEICGTPIALISLIDEERQWFKANVGLEGVEETPRELAFCAHAIQQDGLMEVLDATVDPRFSSNPLVTDSPHIKFYAGAPLVLPSGAKAGTLCVIDRSQKQLTDFQARSLRMLADMVSQALTMRRDLIHRALTVRREAEEVLRAKEALLDRTGRIAGVGGWVAEMASRQIHFSEQACSLLDLGSTCLMGTEAALGMLTGDGEDRLRHALNQLASKGEPLDLEACLSTPTARLMWVRLAGEFEFAEGRPVRLVGAVQDISERLKHKAELKREQDLRHQVERHAHELKTLLSEREEMLDVLTHEVRQPLNNASAALQSASAALQNTQDAAALDRLGRAQGVMSQVMANIDNTLASAALLASKEAIELADTDVDTLVAVAVADVPSHARHRIQVERLASTRTVQADMGLMRLALRNLLLNALKYSPPDTKVIVRLLDWDEPLALVIEVEDAGPGFDAELTPRLFQRGARSRHAGVVKGHGLGLYIVRRVMELHGARVELVRNTPQGSTLQLILEVAQ